MNIEEKMNKLSESIAETNKLFAEITAELATLKEQENNEDISTANILEKYINIRESSTDMYYIDENSEIAECCGVCEFCMNVENPYDVYPTKKLALQAQKMKKFNDLCLAFKYCHDEDYQPDWSKISNDEKYAVCYMDDIDNYEVYVDDDMNRCCIYFSHKEIAQKLADYLNEIDPDGNMVK